MKNKLIASEGANIRRKAKLSLTRYNQQFQHTRKCKDKTHSFPQWSSYMIGCNGRFSWAIKDFKETPSIVFQYTSLESLCNLVIYGDKLEKNLKKLQAMDYY